MSRTSPSASVWRRSGHVAFTGGAEGGEHVPPVARIATTLGETEVFELGDQGGHRRLRDPFVGGQVGDALGTVAFEGVQRGRGGEADVAGHAAHDGRGERVQRERYLVGVCSEIRSQIAHAERL